MVAPLQTRQLTGLEDSHLVTLADGHRLHPEAAAAFAALRADASAAGFDLTIASSYRSCAQQLAIWNVKRTNIRYAEIAGLSAAGNWLLAAPLYSY